MSAPEAPPASPCGSLSRTLRAVVFDLDDTLYAQVEWKRSGFRAVAARLATEGFIISRAQEALEGVLAEFGPSHPRLLNEAARRLGLPEERAPELVEIFRNHPPALTPYPGVPEMLKNLRGAGFLLGLLTDGLARSQRSKVEALGLATLFDALLFTDELGLSKPDPAVFRWFETRFGLAGAQLAYVADNPAKDFVSARRLGWRTIRVLTGEHAGAEAGPGMDAEETTEAAVAWGLELLSGHEAKRPMQR